MPRLLLFAILFMAAPAMGQNLEGPSGIVVSRGEVASPLVQVQEVRNVEPVKIPGIAFRKEVRIAIRQGFRMGKIDRKGYRLLMKAAYAPSQLQAFEDITILQMTGSSQGDEVERTADGKVNREVINWQELRPLLIALLQFFLEYLQDGGI